MTGHPDLFDGCPSAHALDLIGNRWSLLVVRELLLGPKRFTDLRRGLPRISPDVLSQRLNELEAAMILRRRVLAPPAASAVYELTHRGLELETVLRAIGRWGAASPLLPDSKTVGVDPFILGLRSRYDPAASAGLNARYQLRVSHEMFDFQIDCGRLTVRRGYSESPDAVITVNPDAMADIAHGARALSSALAVQEGTADDAKRFAALFSAPA